MPDKRLSGKRVWVTGAGRGLGREIAIAVARCGADVALFARSGEQLEQTAALLEAEDVDVLTVAGSVAESADVAACAELIKSRWGGLDALVNNAGISPSMNRSEKVPESEWREVLDVNLTGAFLCCQRAGAIMLAAGGGSIINVTSVHGSVGMPRLAAYSASKGGLELLTRTLAVEWADRGVRVNAIAPGYLSTSMTEGLRSHEPLRESLLARIPMGRFGTTDEVSELVVYLCSDTSGYVTGGSFAVDGGWAAQ